MRRARGGGQCWPTLANAGGARGPPGRQLWQGARRRGLAESPSHADVLHRLAVLGRPSHTSGGSCNLVGSASHPNPAVLSADWPRPASPQPIISSVPCRSQAHPSPPSKASSQLLAKLGDGCGQPLGLLLGRVSPFPYYGCGRLAVRASQWMASSSHIAFLCLLVLLYIPSTSDRWPLRFILFTV